MTTLLRDELIVATPRPAFRWTGAWQLAACVAVVLIYCMVIRRLGTFTGLRTSAPPLFAWWRTTPIWRHPLTGGLLLLPVSLLFAWRWVLRRRERHQLGEAAMVVAAVLFAFAFDLAVCLLDFERGPGLLDRIGSRFNLPGIQFYYDVRLIHGVRQFLHDYVALHLSGALSVHSNTHPPGSALFFYGVQTLWGPGLLRAGLAASAMGALGVVPGYFIARKVYGRRVAALAAGLLAVTPSFILFGYASMDAVYVLPMLTCVWLYLGVTQAESRRRVVLLSVALGLLMAVCALLTFATCCLAMLMGFYSLASGWRSGRWRRDTAALILAAGVFVGCYVLLYWQTGYHLLECAEASMNADEGMMGKRGGRLGSYLDYSVANLAAYFISLGFVATLLLVRRAGAVARGFVAGRVPDPFMVALVATLALMSFSALFRLETERIWIFLTPLTILPTARWVAGQPRADLDEPMGLSRMDLALGAQLLQLLLMQCTLGMQW